MKEILFGYRAWWLYDNRLYSIVNRDEVPIVLVDGSLSFASKFNYVFSEKSYCWVKGTNKAICYYKPEHQTLDENCSCGFYAANHIANIPKPILRLVVNKEHTMKFIDQDHQVVFAYCRAQIVIGLIVCGGKIVQCERGIRSSEARIDILYQIGPQDISEISKYYGAELRYTNAKSLLRM